MFIPTVKLTEYKQIINKVLLKYIKLYVLQYILYKYI